LSISRSVLQREITKILKGAGLTDVQKLKSYSEAASSVFYSKITAELKDKETIISSAQAYYSRQKNAFLRNVPGNIDKALQEVKVTLRGEASCTIKLLGPKDNQQDLFRILQDAKRVAAVEAIRKIQDIASKDTELVDETRGNLTQLTSRRFIDITHIEGGAVAEIFALDQIKLLEDFKSLPTYKDLSDKQQQIVQGLELELKAVLRVTSGRLIKTVRATLGEWRANQAGGRNVLGPMKKEFTEILNKGVEMLRASIAETKSSDSLVEAGEKIILNSIKDELRKDIKTSFKKRSIKASNGTQVKKRIATFSSSKGTLKDTKAKSSRAAPKRPPQVQGPSVLEMLAYINPRLPDTVAKNMEFPRLEYDTGRFAQSVKVLNIIKTRGGFPSIEYTYQRDPYQVFEMGAGRAPWATPDRDPRKLIDRSIREIAVELLTGRLYTRRV
jgi:hypothetical protein